VDDVVRLALAAKARRLVLFHHDPDHDDTMIDRMQDHARVLARAVEGRLDVVAAYEGLEIDFGRKD
jgi:phosphoribosyl 1,2-cyclic phosphodiesterase